MVCHESAFKFIDGLRDRSAQKNSLSQSQINYMDYFLSMNHQRYHLMHPIVITALAPELSSLLRKLIVPSSTVIRFSRRDPVEECRQTSLVSE